MKLDKYTAILGNTIGYPDMEGLTDRRPLASLPFDAKYRLIDFQLSSLANAGIHSIYGLFQRDNTSSIFDHVRSGREWGLDSLLSHWYLGFYNTKYNDHTTDRAYYEQLLTFLKRSGSDRTVYMGCDMLCNIDIRQVIRLAERAQSPMTVVYKRVPASMVTPANEVLEVSADDEVIGKGTLPEYRAGLAGVDISPDSSTGLAHEFADPDELISMSADIYVLETNWLIAQMEEEVKNEHPRKLRFLLRSLLEEHRALAFGYTGYLANITSVKSYFDANMDMLEPEHFYSLLYSNQKVYTKVKNEESTYFSPECEIEDSQFASGSIIKGRVKKSIISRSCHVDEDSFVCHSIAFSKVHVGAGARVEYAVLDKNVVIQPGVTVKGTPEKPIVITKGSIVEEDIIR
ncbi:glucose-1-phosphate adenylyltransferase subunit GlgD [Alloscardovia macacae]|uniref:Glucose-1-phosphate adenylyltransferase subunit GlgD n=1 Tax=Alloscardovia macacae TaxID=1160091 RepID=A0A1Y2SXA5_9BIFI|nr:glucose-1-phosphate adenylyltransferase subunit GlgD [Alloscardovia macacae]OTA27088.1 glucose-1-phosphate adenylyltransferase subunit GlgD [Alloscardovia macacae]OTA29720.1 glucose-1-phosphate adenylyltransferase subunit GlgD [Alloscardovia macacae]